MKNNSEKDMLVLNVNELATLYNRPVYIIKALVSFFKETAETTYYTGLTSIIDNTTKRVYKFKRPHKYP